MMKKQNTISLKKSCKNLFTKKSGFTLAEVLIVITVIGVVAALTIPNLLANVEERVNSEKQANIVQKVTKAMEVMKAEGNLDNFDSTEEFVNELQKSLKIIKKCDNEHLTECWPTEKVKNADGDSYLVKDAKKRKNLGFLNSVDENNVGLVLADGSAIILTYNPETKNPGQHDYTTPVTKTLPIGNGKSKEFAYTTSVTSGIAFVMDVNGAAKPNTEGEDIRSFNSAHFGTAVAGESGGCATGDVVEGYCVEFVDSYGFINCGRGSDYISYCNSTLGNSYYYVDYWAGANYACQQRNMKLPSPVELYNLYMSNWQNKPSSGTYWTKEGASGNATYVYSFSFADGKPKSATARDSNTPKLLCIASYK